MTIVKTEVLFRAIDKTEHVYTWDYTTYKSAVSLFDVNNDYFAMISNEAETSDETGAMGDYRSCSESRCYLYSKSKLEKLEEFCSGDQENLIKEMRKKPWGSDIRKVESIMLNACRVYISDGNLILDRIQREV